MEERRRLGLYLRALRRERNLTQEQLAERAGIHPTYVSRIESGKALPALDVLARLAAALGVSTADVVRRVEGEGAFPGAEGLRREIEGLLSDATTRQLRLVRDFIAMVRRERHCSESGPEA